MEEKLRLVASPWLRYILVVGRDHRPLPAANFLNPIDSTVGSHSGLELMPARALRRVDHLVRATVCGELSVALHTGRLRKNDFYS
jgi:hypothetical protein